MYYIIYKTVNLVNGKYYYGAHQTRDINDGYLGSGTALKRAIQKYGKENFFREIVDYCSSLEEMYSREVDIILEVLGDDNCYNIKPGGVGGWYSVNSSDINKGDNNVMRRCPYTKKMVTERGMLTKSLNIEHYSNISRENGRKAKEKCTGVPCPSKGNSQKVKLAWRNNYDKMRDALASWFRVTSPDGIVYNTNRLEEFCRDNNLTYVSLWNSSRTNKPVKKGKTKGWICEKILEK